MRVCSRSSSGSLDERGETAEENEEEDEDDESSVWRLLWRRRTGAASCASSSRSTREDRARGGECCLGSSAACLLLAAAPELLLAAFFLRLDMRRTGGGCVETSAHGAGVRRGAAPISDPPSRAIAPLLLTSRQLVGVVRGVLAEPSRIFSICLRASLRLLRVVCYSVCVSVSACDRCSLIACSLLSLSWAGASVALQPSALDRSASLRISAAAACVCSGVLQARSRSNCSLSKLCGGWVVVCVGMVGASARRLSSSADVVWRWRKRVAPVGRTHRNLAPLRSPCT